MTGPCFIFLLLVLLATPGSTSAFAANKKGGKKKKEGGSRTNKGFGAPPPTLEATLSKFRTRVPPDAETVSCPCGTGRDYGDCCGPLHNNHSLCLSMTDVLRSRYSAFSWRLVKHVIETTHETCRDYREDRIAWANDLNKGGMFDSFDFVNLDAGIEEPSLDHENEGFIEFKVTLRAKEDAPSGIAGQETVITERSRFLQDDIDKSWKYASGDVQSDVAGLEGTTLNN